jgi:hypothetical protein
MRPGLVPPAPALWRAALLAAAAALGACASDRSVRLVAPARPAPALEALEAAAPLEPAADPELVHALLYDQRVPELTLGELRNGWGMRVGRIRSDDPVLPWVRSALEVELAAAGLELAPEERSTGPAPDELVLSLGLHRAFCPDRGGAGAEVELDAEVFRAERRLLGRRFLGVVEHAPGQAPEEALAAALQEALQALVLELEKAARQG